MSRSEPSGAQAGFTILETLVALAILAAIAAISASALRGPSPGLQLDRAVSELLSDAGEARRRAVISGKSVTLDVTGCDASESAITFHADGTASGGPACLSIDRLTRRLDLSPLTGRLVPDLRS